MSKPDETDSGTYLISVSCFSFLWKDLQECVIIFMILVFSENGSAVFTGGPENQYQITLYTGSDNVIRGKGGDL